MSAPFIKIYSLPDGYSQAGDNDIQYQASDELLPVTSKFIALSDVLNTAPLTGVVLVSPQPLPATDGNLICFNFAGGQSTETLIANPAQAGYFISQTTPWTSVLYEPYGVLAVVVKDVNSNPLTAAQISINEYGVHFTGATVGTTVTFYTKAAIGTVNTFALLGDTIYAGANDNWNTFWLSTDGGPLLPVTAPAAGIGYVTVTGVTNNLKGRYAYVCNPANTFIAEDYNWVAEHLRMWPDVFSGLEDYPGDTYLASDGVTLINPGNLPAIVAQGTYTVSYHDGTVTFPAPVDGNADPVRVNRSVINGVKNVVGQVLDPVPAKVMACWYSATNFTVVLNLGAATRQVSLYMVDFDNGGRAQTVAITDGNSNNLLAQQAVSNFTAGTWLKLTLTGNVSLVFTRTAGTDAVLSAIALDTTTVTGNSIIGFDAGTQGYTSGRPGATGYGTVVYGGQGGVIIGDHTDLPSAVTITPTGSSLRTWNATGTTQDDRALWIEAIVFQAISETNYPASHGKRWVGRASVYLPTNIYANGVATPQINTTNPYDDLGILMA